MFARYDSGTDVFGWSPVTGVHDTQDEAQAKAPEANAAKRASGEPETDTAHEGPITPPDVEDRERVPAAGWWIDRETGAVCETAPLKVRGKVWSACSPTLPTPATFITDAITDATGDPPYPGSVANEDVENIPPNTPATAWLQTGVEVVETFTEAIPVAKTFSVDIIRPDIDRIEEADAAITAAVTGRGRVLAAFDRPEPLYDLHVRTLTVRVKV